MGLLSGLFYIGKEIIRRAYVKVRNALARFFEKAISMMQKVLDKIESKVKGILLGAAHFYRKIGGKYLEGTKNYSLDKELGEWNETIVTREIPLFDVPPQYRSKENDFEVDDTRELNSSLVY